MGRTGLHAPGLPANGNPGHSIVLYTIGSHHQLTRHTSIDVFWGLGSGACMHGLHAAMLHQSLMYTKVFFSRSCIHIGWFNGYTTPPTLRGQNNVFFELVILASSEICPQHKFF